MKNIDLIAYKIEAYDSDDFISDLSSNGVSYLVILFNPTTGYTIINNIDEELSAHVKFLTGFIAINFNRFFYSLLFPFTFLIDYALTSIKINKMIKLYNPTNAFVDNTFIAVHFATLRKKSKINNLIYASHDWLEATNKGLGLSSLAKRAFSCLFIYSDKYVCKNADIILNHTSLVEEARRNYWGKNIISGSEYIYKPNLTPVITGQISFNKQKGVGKICFLGNATKESGLELILESIKGTDLELNVVGIKNEFVDSIENLENYKHFQYLGFGKRSNFNDIFDKAFVGVNLITCKNTHTNYTVPSKVIDYIRHGLPVIVTKNIGPFANIIELYEIGVVINPTKNEILKALEKIRVDNVFFQKNIKLFFKKYPFSNLLDYLKL